MCPGTRVGCSRCLHMQQSGLLLYGSPKNCSKLRVSALALYDLIPRNLIARDPVVCSTPCRLLWWTCVEQFLCSASDSRVFWPEVTRVGWVIYTDPSTSLLEFPVGEGKLNVPPTTCLHRVCWLNGMRDCLLSRMMSCYSSIRGVANKHCNMVRNSYALVSLELGERKQKVRVCSLVSSGVRHTSLSLRCRLRISDIPTIYLVYRRVNKISSICPSASTEKLIFHCTDFCVTSPRFCHSKTCH